MLVRFSILEADPDSGQKAGVLVAAHTLRDEGELSAQEHEQVRSALQWFNEHVEVPEVLEAEGNHRAISWFKPAARVAISKMWELKSLLEHHGLHVEVLRTLDPGLVVYEDELQVVAKPRRGQRFR